MRPTFPSSKTRNDRQGGSMGRAHYLDVVKEFRLNQACYWVWQAFGHVPDLVGSAMERQDYRDVDVRLILPDDEYARLFPDDPATWGRMSLWSYLCAAISDQLARASGLPVDFQIQSQAD